MALESCLSQSGTITVFSRRNSHRWVSSISPSPGPCATSDALSSPSCLLYLCHVHVVVWLQRRVDAPVHFVLADHGSRSVLLHRAHHRHLLSSFSRLANFLYILGNVDHTPEDVVTWCQLSGLKHPPVSMDVEVRIHMMIVISVRCSQYHGKQTSSGSLLKISVPSTGTEYELTVLKGPGTRSWPKAHETISHSDTIFLNFSIHFPCMFWSGLPNVSFYYSQLKFWITFDLKMHIYSFKKHIKIYIKIHINVAPTCFGLRPSSGSLH